MKEERTDQQSAVNELPYAATLLDDAIEYRRVRNTSPPAAAAVAFGAITADSVGVLDCLL